jgi:hypothetical protein
VKVTGVLVQVVLYVSYASGWTWTYNKDLVQEFAHKHTHYRTRQWCWIQRTQNYFSELIFSWNALRPIRGYYSFWIRVRERNTKQWYAWHEMARWGTDAQGNILQKSFTSKHRLGTHYAHVRLEMPKSRVADAFEVKIKAHSHACLANIRGIAVNTYDFSKFVSERIPACYTRLRKLASVYLAQVPRKSQMNLKHPQYRSLCSPTSVSILLSYLLDKTIDACAVARGVFDQGLKIYGSWPFNIAHAFEVAQGSIFFQVERLHSFKTLHSLLCQGIPVIVSVRGALKGAPLHYEQGHLLVVVGWNQRFGKVLCHDPSFKSDHATAVAYDLDEFLAAWERSKRLAYRAIKLDNKE